ncbi:glucokinase [Pseudooceanicola sp. CBS1P-1]|uniref:Glucokinase n=1 Tax=Pseudooceanicola albus TaxID=2692189 RepID=A0A6L7GA41_9RHOB|nr:MULTISPECIES: glucokinase [Pseudooceanicola]MBT9386529.1 glucokinase [Pseudooceanicola endophyticus]MXN20562.1 glucokinase [Pseudooceanicola albus]
MKLVADVGGTNVRFALAEGAVVLPETIRSFRNDDFPTFEEVAQLYVAETRPEALQSMCVAVAGPVNETRARLTNRNWHFDTLELGQMFGVTARLINDLEALGYSVPSLGQGGLKTITEGYAPRGHQALVAGIGTGFNVSPVVITARGPVVPKAEQGHVQIAWRIRDAISARLGTTDHGYDTVEHVFSGRGFERMFRLASGSDRKPAELMAEKDPAILDFVGFYAGLMAMLAQDLTLGFLPGRGLLFSGGVARAVLLGGGAPAFRETYAAPLALDTAAHVPVSVILDDTAALAGCAAA